MDDELGGEAPVEVRVRDDALPGGVAGAISLCEPKERVWVFCTAELGSGCVRRVNEVMIPNGALARRGGPGFLR